MRKRTGVLAAVLLLTAAAAGCSEDEPKPAPPPPPALSPFAITGRGATVPFTEYEAEAAAYQGKLVEPDRTAKTLAAEASGRQAVTLSATGDYVEFTLAKPANALTLRYSVPDSADGAGADATLSVHVDGADTLDVPVTSRYGWFYGGFPFTNNPADGSGHHFYDHARTLFDREIPAGAKVRIIKDAADTAASYTIDLADFEQVAPPATAPDGALNVVDFGADPTGKADSAAAITAALAEGKAKKRPVWLPPGTFQVNQHLIVDQVTLLGAGMWHSVLHGKDVGLYGNYAPKPSEGVTLSDFSIIGETGERDDNAQVNGVGGALGGGSKVQNLWIQHTKVGMWLDGPFDGLTISGNRIYDQTADGINLHRGVSNTVIEHNVIRNTGDDGIATWADEFPDHHNTIRFNTVLLPMLANGIAIYGGHDNTVSDNVVADTLVEGGGLHVANRFGGTVFLSGTTTLTRNTTLRAGGRFEGLQAQIAAVWLYAKDGPIDADIRITDNELLDSTYGGLMFFASTIRGVTVDKLLVDSPGTFGVALLSMGEAKLSQVTVVNPGKAGLYTCPDGITFTLTATDSTGLADTYCGPLPDPVYRFARHA
ncbi:glycosyl hydrolase family 28-related protein [Catellatospora tritici]|uniref:glycosyl hydrolase family 28-related protein n=1 Tax=Catellatospora tritici TaxID=2851566 RepID=UPI001C2D691E|nr:glycosyl hydrolase family 28-related protein [Catellatospora tritici]MBV1851543.1 right-handed parallel beta-helix repeat-containing protein [Catellatospora tritici]